MGVRDNFYINLLNQCEELDKQIAKERQNKCGECTNHGQSYMLSQQAIGHSPITVYRCKLQLNPLTCDQNFRSIIAERIERQKRRDFVDGGRNPI